VRRGELGARGGRQVHVEDVGEPQQVDEHVRHLLAGAGPAGRLREPLDGTVGREPLEQLRELADLADERQDERLRVLELLPVALGAELPHQPGQLRDLRFRHGGPPRPRERKSPTGVAEPDARGRVRA
jgi:hypothetical protein